MADEVHAKVIALTPLETVPVSAIAFSDFIFGSFNELFVHWILQ